MKIYVTADFHYDERATYKTQADANMDAIIAKANGVSADLLVCAGDILFEGIAGQTESPLRWEELRTEAEFETALGYVKSKLDGFTGSYGYIVMPGNHDGQHVKIFEEYFGYRYKFELIGGVLVLALSTGDLGSYYEGYVSGKQLKDLKDAVDGDSNTNPAIAILHAPPYQFSAIPEGIRVDLDGWAMGSYWHLRNKDAVMAILDDHSRMKVVLTGHIWPAAAGYETAATINYVKKRHTTIQVGSPYFILKDDYIVDINTGTGLVNVDVWKYDTSEQADVLEVTV